jgi:hypothetical protein
MLLHAVSTHFISVAGSTMNGVVEIANSDVTIALDRVSIGQEHYAGTRFVFVSSTVSVLFAGINTIQVDFPRETVVSCAGGSNLTFIGAIGGVFAVDSHSGDGIVSAEDDLCGSLTFVNGTITVNVDRGGYGGRSAIGSPWVDGQWPRLDSLTILGENITTAGGGTWSRPSRGFHYRLFDWPAETFCELNGREPHDSWWDDHSDFVRWCGDWIWRGFWHLC